MKHWHRKFLAIGMLAGLGLSAAVPTGRVVATGVGVAVYESELDAAYRRYVMAQATLGVNVSPLIEKAIQKQHACFWREFKGVVETAVQGDVRDGFGECACV